MRSVRFLTVVVFLIAISGCLEDGDFTGPVPSTTGGTGAVEFVAPGPCPITDPIGFAMEVEHENRGDFFCPDSTWWSTSNMIGAPDGIFTSLGGDAGNFFVVEMEKEFADGNGADLVVFSIEMGDSIEGYYNVYVSDNADSGFILVDSVRSQGNWCIDLAGSGVTSGKYIKIEQYYSIPGFDMLPACSTSYGPDIDAVGVLNEAIVDTCKTFDDLCEFVGAVVDTICPASGEYPNHGAYVSCVAHAATDVLKDFRDDPCYDENFIGGVHGCVVSKRAQTDIGKKGN